MAQSNIMIEGQIYDAASLTPPPEGREFRDAYAAPVNGVIQLDPARKQAILATLTSDECRRRIYAVINQTAQDNLNGERAAERLTAEENATYDAGLTWVFDMRKKVIDLVAADTDLATMRDDASWPPVPSGVAELAAKY
jgi:hypothetical protein